MTELVLTCSLQCAFASRFTSCPLSFRAAIVILNTLPLPLKKIMAARDGPNGSESQLFYMHTDYNQFVRGSSL